MKRLLRWIGIAFGALLVLALLAYLVVYVVSERTLRRTYPVPHVALTLPTDPEAIAEGRRLATIRGCFAGCHGRAAEGAVLSNQPLIARLVAPNLPAAARRYNAGQLAAIIRYGLRPDGRSVVVMPSEAFAGLSDDDLARIVAFLRSLPDTPGPGPDITLGPLGRLGFALGQFRTAAQLRAAARPLPAARAPQAAQGRYLAQTICAHCHGTDLRGESNPEFTSPPLQVVAAYPPDAFTQLLRTGVALGGRRLGVMAVTAQRNLALLSDAEIASLYTYLHALPATAGE